jgi:hypothetical protein
MRSAPPIALLVVLAGAATTARAEATPARDAVTQLVQALFAHLDEDHGKAQLGKSPIVITIEGRRGQSVWADYVLPVEQRTLSQLAPRDLVVTVNAAGTQAWFHARIDGTSASQTVRDVARVTGIATLDGSDWRIPILAFSSVIPDKQLFARAFARPARAPITQEGDHAIDTLVAGWVRSGLGPHAAATEQLVAIGTAPREHAIGVAAPELVRAWDKLALQVQRIYTDDEGDMALVQADVLLPVRGKVTAMSFVAILARPDAAGDWRWVALQFSPRSLDP